MQVNDLTDSGRGQDLVPGSLAGLVDLDISLHMLGMRETLTKLSWWIMATKQPLLGELPGTKVNCYGEDWACMEMMDGLQSSS